ncbi:MAG: hypothetical protein AAF637_17840, partial [Pseudomonadota bacterium]
MSFAPDLTLLAHAMDRVVPPVDDLPGAGSMGLAEEVVERSRSDHRFWSALEAVISNLPAAGDFGDLNGDQQDATLSAVEQRFPRQFGHWLDVVYTVYYMQPAVHRRLGWHGRPPQPDGNQMPPWNESVLDTIRNREPFWKKA